MTDLDLNHLRVMQEAAEYCARQSAYGHHDATVHLPPDVLKALLDRIERQGRALDWAERENPQFCSWSEEDG